jgi:hypothetical protein
MDPTERMIRLYHWSLTIAVKNLSSLSKKGKLIYFLIALTKTAKPVTSRSEAAFL